MCTSIGSQFLNYNMWIICSLSRIGYYFQIGAAICSYYGWFRIVFTVLRRAAHKAAHFIEIV